jgi:hypothetical protein
MADEFPTGVELNEKMIVCLLRRSLPRLRFDVFGGFADRLKLESNEREANEEDDNGEERIVRQIQRRNAVAAARDGHDEEEELSLVRAIEFTFYILQKRFAKSKNQRESDCLVPIRTQGSRVQALLPDCQTPATRICRSLSTTQECDRFKFKYVSSI